MSEKKPFNFMDHIPEGYVSTTEVVGGVTVRTWRNPNPDPEIRQKKLNELGQMLYDFMCEHQQELQNNVV